MSVNEVDEFGNTGLIMAAQNNSKRMVKLFLKYRGEINACNSKGNTAMHYACCFNYSEVAQTLKKYGARTDIRNLNGDICYTMNKI